MPLTTRTNKTYSSPPQMDLQVDYFNGGLNVLQQDNRLKKNESPKATNLMLQGEGFYTKRWGTKDYGASCGGSVLDGAGEYIKSDNTREIIMIANGKVYRHGISSCTEITGATFTAGVKASTLQIGGFLYIANGVDDLARYNGTTLSKYTQLSAPASPSASRGAGLSAGSFNNYYIITALNDVGETTGSIEVNETTNIVRTEWSGATQIITVSWSAVSGASRYQIYYDDESGYEVLLAETTSTSFVDDGTLTPNPYIEVPDDNTTSGPKFSDMDLSSNRIWGTKDPTNKYRVYWSGTGVNQGIFSDFYGGGWVDLEKGGRDKPIAVRHYKTGSGIGNATVFCSTPEGKGSIWQITLESLTIEGTTFVVPIPTKIIGSVGTSAPRSVVKVRDDIFFFNKDGVFVLGNEPNYFSVLRSNELSAKIRPIVRSITQSAIENVCAYFYDEKVFFSIPKTTDSNNRIVYYDMERKCWIGEWTIGFSLFLQHTDSNSNTKLLGGSTTDGKLVEISSAYGNDNGTAFNTIYLSPKFPVDSDWTQFNKTKKCYFRLNNARGRISVSIIGSEKRKQNIIQSTKTIETLTINTGLGFDPMGTVLLGQSNGVPSDFEFTSIIRYMKINKRLSDLQFRITTDTSDSTYVLVGLKSKGIKLSTNDPSDRRLN